MTSRTLEQERAEDALKCAREMSSAKKYRSYVDRLGPAIVMNGLGQALATEIAAGGEHKALYKNVECWLCRSEGGVYSGSGDVGLLASIVRHGQDKYLHAQAEALAWLRWHKKFCRAFLRDGAGGE